jgi:Ca2+-transporting ATPase
MPEEADRSEEDRTAPWWAQSVDAVCRSLSTDPEEGLGGDEARQRLQKHGRNVLVAGAGRGPWEILYEQFTSLMMLLLLGAGLVSGPVLGEWTDMTVILVIVVLNGLLGFRQEYKAEQAMQALKRMAVPEVRVRRGGTAQTVPAEELVPGDIVLFEAGDIIPADCRVVEAANLQTREAALTGEALPVYKSTEPLEDPEASVGDRRCMAYRGTAVTYGRGAGVVVATGMETELGSIATMIQSAEEEKTVLQQKLAHLSKILVFVALALIAVVAVQMWLLQQMTWTDIFLTGVSMAVAAIPEGLPAVVTISLALGAQRMLRRRALIRRLPAVETLGSVTVICSDKTGTLTQNRMVVTELRLPDGGLDLPETADGRRDQLRGFLQQTPLGGTLLAGMSLCADASIDPPDGGEGFKTTGDPTEGALVAAAAWAGWEKEALEDAAPRIDERPFDSDRKRMTTVHALPEDAGDVAWLEPVRPVLDGEGAAAVGWTKGAPDAVLEVCDRVWADGRVEQLDEEMRGKLRHEAESLASNGLRVLSLALRPHRDRDDLPETLEESLVYVGLVGMVDPLREEVVAAVERSRRAGVRPVMITGDHPLIARYIGKQLGLRGGDRYLTGKDLQGMDTQTLREEVRDVSIFARVAPEHKLKIVDALQQNGHIVAMTGDGVNDAPALKEADIGVAMGITGTDVSQQAADMVLQDDNFATIVAAVEEGRTILDNILRFVRYILASNAAEVLAMLAAPLFGLPLPLLPAQILWMNLVTDGLPALALGIEKAEPDVMDRPPREPDAPIISPFMAAHIVWVGALMVAVALTVGGWYYTPAAHGGEAAAHGHGGVIKGATWQTMIFTVLVFSQFTLALAERSHRDSIWTIGFFSNRYMAYAIAICFLLQLGVIYLPFLQFFFDTVPLTLPQVGLCLAASTIVFFAVEIEKTFKRWRAR